MKLYPTCAVSNPAGMGWMISEISLWFLNATSSRGRLGIDFGPMSGTWKNFPATAHRSSSLRYHHPVAAQAAIPSFSESIVHTRSTTIRKIEVASSPRIWPIKQRSEDRVNDPRLPVRFGSLLLRCPEARSNIDLGRNVDHESFSTLGPRRALPVRIVSAHHQTVFKPPFMTSIGPIIAVHDRR